MTRPTTGLCPVCNTAFAYSMRKQGGGRRPIYCSPKCRSLDWVRGNGAKRKATVLKYERSEQGQLRRKVIQRNAKLRKYGWTLEDFGRQLVRQNFSCAGCLKPINDETARVDHCHKTNKVRGLLCNSCNWALGHTYDRASTLRRLMAYMERDLTKTLVYLIGSLKNSRIPEIGNVLRAQGYDVMDEWFTPGKHADENWQKYEKLRGRKYAEALKGRAATNIFLFDRAYLDLADVVVLVMPAGKSAMLELGYARGRKKFAVLFLDGEEPTRYDVMPQLVDAVAKTEQELIAIIEEKGYKHERRTEGSAVDIHAPARIRYNRWWEKATSGAEAIVEDRHDPRSGHLLPPEQVETRGKG